MPEGGLQAAAGAVRSAPAPLLEIENLHVHFVTSRGTVRAVENVGYAVRPGEIVAIVGESGSGKSVSALAVMRLLAKPAGRVVAGAIRFAGRDLLSLSDEEMRALRGREIAMIFQEPMTSLNPVLTIGRQITEPLFIHLAMTPDQARARAIELLAKVGITDPERRLDQYPHQFSGGMRQRVMIALALACDPKLLIADEPTTALDVTIQAQILELLKDLSRELGIAVMLITHNLGIVARYADRVNVMYAARQVEQGPAEAVFATPRHPYTSGLLGSVPRIDRPRTAKLDTIEGSPPDLLAPPPGCRFAPRCPHANALCETEPPLVEVAPGHRSACARVGELPDLRRQARAGGGAGTLPTIDPQAPPIVEARGLKRHFKVSRATSLFGREHATVKAVDDVSFVIRPGETLGLVGESGCGKTTVGRLLLRLETLSEGEIRIRGRSLAGIAEAELRRLRQKIQVIFQDPFSSLNPRMTVGDIIAEPMRVHALQPDQAAARRRARELLEMVGLFPYMAERYPHEMSGGQRQRVGIARALALQPEVIVCDEPVSALDVSIQGQIINLLETLQAELGLTYLFIAHDLAVVRHISTRVAVMYLGRIVELADRDRLYARPLHPYTQALLDAAPVPDPQVERARAPRTLRGEIPSPLRPPPGCVFNTRCPLASEECRQAVPALRIMEDGHQVACIKV